MLMVGGGFTGLWTAWQLKRPRPAARVVLCEAGAAARGRVAVTAASSTGSGSASRSLRERFGDERARSRSRTPRRARSPRSAASAVSMTSTPGSRAGRLHAGLDRARLRPRVGGGRGRLRGSSVSPRRAPSCSRAEVRQRCDSPSCRGRSSLSRAPRPCSRPASPRGWHAACASAASRCSSGRTVTSVRSRWRRRGRRVQARAGAREAPRCSRPVERWPTCRACTTG